MRGFGVVTQPQRRRELRWLVAVVAALQVGAQATVSILHRQFLDGLVWFAVGVLIGFLAARVETVKDKVNR